jgi:hypothetical protein
MLILKQMDVSGPSYSCIASIVANISIEVQQISDGQVQVVPGKPVTQISDGQLQVSGGTPVNQISDGQLQVPSGMPVSQIAGKFIPLIPEARHMLTCK